MKKIILEFTGTYHKTKLYNKSYLEGICESDDEDRYLYCPYRNDLSTCGSVCAWFDIEEKCRVIASKDYMIDEENYKVITCKGTPIGELVEEEKDNGQRG